MLVIETKGELNSFLGKVGTPDASVGLVPTMGALHAGHLSLVQRAFFENEIVVVSIFVNPTQFNDSQDLESYPRTLQSDLELLAPFKSKVTVFNPTIKEMYPEGQKIEEYPLNGLDKVMEGIYRKEHFNGVCTVVEALFRAVGPDKAYFGEKDFQQLQIIRKMAHFKKLDLEIIGCPIVREESGLAMSSRNAKLSEKMRKEAAGIYKILKAASKKFGTKSANQVKEWVRNTFKKHPELKLEYIEIADELTLTPVTRKNKERKYRAFVAVYIGGVRLIDNIPLY